MQQLRKALYSRPLLHLFGRDCMQRVSYSLTA